MAKTPVASQERPPAIVVTLRARKSKAAKARKTYVAVCLDESREIERGPYAKCLAAAKKHTLSTWHAVQVMEE